MFIKMKKPNYLQPHCKMSIVLAFPTVGHSPSTVLFVPSSPGNSQKPRLNQRSSTPTCLSSTRHGSNVHDSNTGMWEWDPSLPQGVPTCLPGFISAFHKTGPHLACWPSVYTFPQCHPQGLFADRPQRRLSAAFRASTTTWRTSFLSILFPKFPIKDNNRLHGTGAIHKPQAPRAQRASKATQGTVRPPADSLWPTAWESVPAISGHCH